MAISTAQTPTSAPLSQTGPVLSQPLLTTHVVLDGKLYRVEACVDVGNTNAFANPPHYSPESLQQIKSQVQDLFSAHELRHNTLNQGPLNAVSASSQGLIRSDGSTLSHDFLIEPLDSALAARIASENTTLASSSLKALDIWNRLSASILAGRTPQPSPPTSPQTATISPSALQTDPIAATAPILPNFANQTGPTTPSHSADLFPLFGEPRPIPRPEHSNQGGAPIPPPYEEDDPWTPAERIGSLTNAPTSTDVPILPDSNIHTEQPLIPPGPDEQAFRVPAPQRRTVLSTEMQLKDHDFTAENWYEAIPLRTRLRICQNILKAQSIYPVERRVWNRFQQIYDHQIEPKRVQTVALLIHEEVRKLQQQCRKQPSILRQRQRNRAEHFLRRYEQKAPPEELHRWIQRYQFDEQFFTFFEEQIAAEALPIPESERATWAREHYADDLRRFVQVLERYLDSN